MSNKLAIKALLSAFLQPPVTVDELLRRGAKILESCTGIPDALGEVIDAFAFLLRERAIECLPGGILELRRENYPDWLFQEVCGPDPFAHRDLSDSSTGLYMRLSELPPYLQAEFQKRGLVQNHEGDHVVTAEHYLPFVDEHCRSPLRSLFLYADHPLIDDVENDIVRPVIRWNQPYISWHDQVAYSPGGSDVLDWWAEEEEVRNRNGAIVEVSL